ncbi:uncharacterized protein [Solanum lycopersicum]|uniref:uncharacterized protein n=1 Tax=Solanum lycopersicum TaxID=4081 RepID=UPI003748366A
MALVQHFGRPDLFMTMTCNHDWIEIQQELRPGQTPQDRADLVTRVFKAKLQDLKEQIFKKEIFGIVVAHVFVVEFQKRGQPHIHLLLKLKEGHNIKSGDQYDRFISAKIPDKYEYPILHKLVLKHMMHGPCGNKRPTKKCMQNGQCKYHYPRPYNNKSIQAKDGYPIYKRRMDGRIEIVRGMHMTNIYVQSGDGENAIDEIQTFQDARLVSPPEALWRIYEFNLTEMQPAVINLQLHLPEKHLEYGKSIDIYDIPQLDHNFLEVGSSECRKIIEEMSVQIPPEHIDAQSQLNPEQHHAFTKIMKTINAGTTAIFFVDGPGGTGKTYLYRALLANVRSRGMIDLATATSGVAASILPGGRTTHSRFEILIQTSESTMTNMSKQSGVAKLIRKAKVIIWDEAPMAKRQTIETVDRSFRDIMDIYKPFGGKVMVFGGDFRQVLPVVPKSTQAEIVNASLVKSYLWPLMEKIQFTRNMRARTDPTLSEFLLRVGNSDEPIIRENLILLPEELTIKHSKDEIPEESMIKEIFQNLQENADNKICH